MAQAWEYLILEALDGEWRQGRAAELYPERGRRVDLAELGRRGWEAVGFTARDHLLLKRPLPHESATELAREAEELA